jgi:Holliday junction resolvase RusA-like endonuclease
MDCVRFTVFGPPRPKERPRLGAGGHTYTPKRTKQYEAAIRGMGSFHMLRGWDLHGLYRVTVRFVFEDERARDVDNCLKAVLDGLNRIAWDDDSQVTEAHASKAVEPGRTRTEVCIERIGERTRTKRARRKT